MCLYEVLLLYTPFEVQWSSVSTGIGFVNIWVDFHKPGHVFRNYWVGNRERLASQQNTD